LAPDRLAGITHRQAPRACRIPLHRHRLAEFALPPCATLSLLPPGASTLHRKTPVFSRSPTVPIPPGGSYSTARRAVLTVATATDLRFYRLAPPSCRQALYQ